MKINPCKKFPKGQFLEQNPQEIQDFQIGKK